MGEFIYVAVNAKGEKISGEVEAQSPQKAVALLQSKKLTVLAVDPVKPKHWVYYFLRPVKGTILALFIRQLAVMLKSGIPLASALVSLQPDQGPAHYRKAIRRLLHDVRTGYSLSQAMMKAPQFFNPFMIGSTRIGEVSGNLAETLSNCAEHFEKEYHYGKKLQSALIYPSVLLTCAGALVMFIFTFMIPKFVGLFVDLSMELPWATQWLVDIARFLEVYGTVTFFTLVGPVSILSWLFFNWARTKRGQYTLERITLAVPWYGIQVRHRMLAQYFRSFATLVQSGVTLHSSLNLLTRALDRQHLSRTAAAQAAAVRKGLPLTHEMNAYRLFPPMCIEMVKVGEHTGEVSNMMMRMALYFDEEMSRGLATISKLVEPVVLMILGSVVAFILLAAFLPIYQLAGSF